MLGGQVEGQNTLMHFRLDDTVRHDKEGMKTAVRDEFKSRFDGSDKPFENVREAVGPDGRYDEEVNKELEWEEFESNLNGLKNGRAGGVDGIRNELLKECGERAKRLLFLFTRSMMETGYVPEELNVGRVKLIFKSGDPLDLANYRPITVSSVIVKLYKNLQSTSEQSV